MPEASASAPVAVLSRRSESALAPGPQACFRKRKRRAPAVAVQFGAGSIGRGFMGELFWANGCRTVFVEVDPTLVRAINERRSYVVHHITNDGDTPVRVTDVSALDAADAQGVARAVAGADIACTAVGVRALGAVAPALARGMMLRVRQGNAAPLNVITCENLLGAGRFLRDLVWAELEAIAGRDRQAAGIPAPHLARADFDARFGFVEAVVSRMVPVVPDAVRRSDPLWIACEPYARLPVDGPAFRGPLPRIAGLEPVANIAAHQQRKLASHNMSHALAAYLGYQAGHEFIWQAMADPDVCEVVCRAMDETGRALVARFGFDPAEQRAHEEDLRGRYCNRALGDQVRRVAADPLRKLGREDRLIGSARLCLEEGVEPEHVLVGIRAALAYNDPRDAAAVRLQQKLASRGREAVLREVCGLGPQEPLYDRLRE
ncbi:MAG: hypothetical protein FJ288_17615 [Planctomycetes bacterium]|nr:hypothetical protein [Planctomycetota bacterium]